jgi:hypothetical protein
LEGGSRNAEVGKKRRWEGEKVGIGRKSEGGSRKKKQKTKSRGQVSEGRGFRLGIADFGLRIERSKDAE